jgi:hypothetical protein
MNEQDGDLNSDMVRFFGRHLVSISCTHFVKKDGSDARYFLISGFLVSVEDTWFVATAGHVLRQIADLVGEHPERQFLFRIVDFFGPDSVHTLSIPFDFISSMRFILESDDVDFGLVHLAPFYQRQMQVNNQTPLTEVQWRQEPDIDAVAYFLIGIPIETVNQLPGDIVKPDHIHGQRFDVTMLFVKRLDELPATIDRKPMMFYGALGETPDLTSIQGMSGCPIVAVGKNEAGEPKYWIVAVQSGWYYERMPRIVYGNGFRPLMLSAEAYFDGLGQEQEPSALPE